MAWSLAIALVLTTLPAPWSVSASNPLTPDAARVAPAPATPPARDTAVAKIYLLGAVHFYQHWISPADGASCGFYPTCSGYAVDALRKHGAVVGFVMTAERVMRNHGGASYPLVDALGRARLYDPVDANDYWWSKPAAIVADAATPAASPAPLPAEPEPDLGFARSLYDDGDYYRAIGEAKRVLYHHPGDRDAQVLIGRAYLAGEQWTAAEAALGPVASVDADAAFALADARMGAKSFDLAALDYRHFASDFPADPRAALAALRTGWARLYSADAIARRDARAGRVAFRAAAAELRALPADHPEHDRVAALAGGADALASMPRVSPALAGTLSAIVPGAGQIYAHRIKDGIIALFVNGLFVAGAVEAFRLHNDVTGGTLVLFEMGWYSGNIYSAINSAHRTNDERRARFLSRLKQDLYFAVTPGPDGAPRAAIGGRFP